MEYKKCPCNCGCTCEQDCTCEQELLLAEEPCLENDNCLEEEKVVVVENSKPACDTENVSICTLVALSPLVQGGSIKTVTLRYAGNQGKAFFSKDGFNWQPSPIFENLTIGRIFFIKDGLCQVAVVASFGVIHIETPTPPTSNTPTSATPTSATPTSGTVSSSVPPTSATPTSATPTSETPTATSATPTSNTPTSNTPTESGSVYYLINRCPDGIAFKTTTVLPTSGVQVEVGGVFYVSVGIITLGSETNVGTVTITGGTNCPPPVTPTSNTPTESGSVYYLINRCPDGIAFKTTTVLPTSGVQVEVGGVFYVSVGIITLGSETNVGTVTITGGTNCPPPVTPTSNTPTSETPTATSATPTSNTPTSETPTATSETPTSATPTSATPTSNTPTPCEFWNISNNTGSDIVIDYTCCNLSQVNGLVIPSGGQPTLICVPNDGLTYLGIDSVFDFPGHNQIDTVANVSVSFGGACTGGGNCPAPPPPTSATPTSATPTTSTSTVLSNCTDCHQGLIINNDAYQYRDCNGVIFNGGAEGGTEICFNPNLSHTNIQDLGVNITACPCQN